MDKQPDIAERLRFFATQTTVSFPGYLADAADEIESLRSKLDEYRKADEAGLEREVASLERIKELESRLDSVTRERDDAVAAMSRHANRVLTQQRDEARSRLDYLRNHIQCALQRQHELCEACGYDVRRYPDDRDDQKPENLCPFTAAVVERKCGQPVANIGGAENMVWICTLPEGHPGNCFNEYVGENVVERHEHIVGQINPTESGDVIIEFERTSRPGVELSICALCSKQFSPE